MKHQMVSAIVLNWNGKDVIEKCLDSLLSQNYHPREIIVVDNGSGDGSLELIRHKYQRRIVLIENRKNLGFAEGCNVGIRAAQGEYIVLVNSDAILEKDWITEMVKGVSRSESIGMAAGKIYFAGDWGRIENTGHVIYRDGLGRGRGRLEKDRGQFDRKATVFCPNGCAAIYRKKVMEEAELFDKRFFAYADDIDIGFRIRLLGYECAYVSSAIAHHRLSASFGMLSPLKAFLVERNRLWVLIKCFPLRDLLFSPFYTLIRYLYHFYGMLRHMGPASRYIEKISMPSLLLIAAKVYVSTLWHLPYLIGQRFKIMKTKRVSNRDFEGWFEKYGMTAREVALNEISY